MKEKVRINTEEPKKADHSRNLDKEDTDYLLENLLINYILCGDIQDIFESLVRNNNICLNFDLSRYWLCITGLSRKYQSQVFWVAQKKGQLPPASSKYIKDCLAEMNSCLKKSGYAGNACLNVEDESRRAAIIFSPQKDTSFPPEDMAHTLELVYLKNFPFTKDYIATSLTGPYSGQENLHVAAYEASKLGDLLYFDLKNRIITPSLVKSLQRKCGIQALYESLRRVRSSLCFDGEYNCVQTLSYLFDDILRPSLSIEYVFISYTFMEEIFRAFSLAYPEKLSLYAEPFEKFLTLDQYQAYLSDNIHQIFSSLQKTPRYSPGTLLTISFVKSHPSEDLSLVRLAENIGINPSSLSSVFKRDTGTSLAEFITVSRIDYAKNLIRENNYITAELAVRSGFGSAEYFRKVFKKQTGLTLEEYRKQVNPSKADTTKQKINSDSSINE